MSTDGQCPQRSVPSGEAWGRGGWVRGRLLGGTAYPRAPAMAHSCRSRSRGGPGCSIAQGVGPTRVLFGVPLGAGGEARRASAH